MKFFTVAGNEISKEEFIDLYSKTYYGDSDGEHIKGLTKNSRIVEAEIDIILKKGIQNEMDLVHILAWKLGKLKLGESTEHCPFVYHSDWDVNEEKGKYSINRYGEPFPIQDFFKYIVSNISRLQSMQPQEILNDLNAISIDGIGTVYLITFLYFITKAKYPIYDQFTWLALEAIKSEENPAETKGIEYKEFPTKNSFSFKSICDKEYAGFIKDINSVFNEYNRDIDRALWSYGHLFKLNNSNCR